MQRGTGSGGRDRRGCFANCKLSRANTKGTSALASASQQTQTAKKLQRESRRGQELAQGGTRGLSRKIIACFAGRGEILRSNLLRAGARFIRRYIHRLRIEARILTLKKEEGQQPGDSPEIFKRLVCKIKKRKTILLLLISRQFHYFYQS